MKIENYTNIKEEDIPSFSSQMIILRCCPNKEVHPAPKFNWYKKTISENQTKEANITSQVFKPKMELPNQCSYIRLNANSSEATDHITCLLSNGEHSVNETKNLRHLLNRSSELSCGCFLSVLNIYLLLFITIFNYF